jgi:hypothetical protein
MHLFGFGTRERRCLSDNWFNARLSESLRLALNYHQWPLAHLLDYGAGFFLGPVSHDRDCFFGRL